MFLRLFSAEFRKLREMMTLLTLLAGPGLVGALAFIGAAVRPEEVAWIRVSGPMINFWVMLLFPLAFVAFAAFAAQVEHRARAWDHLLTLPAPKWMVFTVKALGMALAAMAMNLLFVAFLLAGGMLGGLISPHGPFLGPIPLQTMARAVGVATLAAALMVAVQTWLSLRFSHFIAPILIGIGGAATGFAGLALEQSEKTRFLPWATPNEVMMRMGAEGPDFERMLAYGAGGGLIAFLAMVLNLSRREMR